MRRPGGSAAAPGVVDPGGGADGGGAGGGAADLQAGQEIAAADRRRPQDRRQALPAPSRPAPALSRVQAARADCLAGIGAQLHQTARRRAERRPDDPPAWPDAGRRGQRRAVGFRVKPAGPRRARRARAAALVTAAARRPPHLAPSRASQRACGSMTSTRPGRTQAGHAAGRRPERRPVPAAPADPSSGMAATDSARDSKRCGSLSTMPQALRPEAGEDQHWTDQEARRHKPPYARQVLPHGSQARLRRRVNPFTMADLLPCPSSAPSPALREPSAVGAVRGSPSASFRPWARCTKVT
jgi:hypothetical protein